MHVASDHKVHFFGVEDRFKRKAHRLSAELARFVRVVERKMEARNHPRRDLTIHSGEIGFEPNPLIAERKIIALRIENDHVHRTDVERVVHITVAGEESEGIGVVTGGVGHEIVLRFLRENQRESARTYVIANCRIVKGVRDKWLKHVAVHIPHRLVVGRIGVREIACMEDDVGLEPGKGLN